MSGFPVTPGGRRLSKSTVRRCPKPPTSALRHHGQRQSPRPTLTSHPLPKQGGGRRGHGGCLAGLGAEGWAELRLFWSRSVHTLPCEARANKSNVIGNTKTVCVVLKLHFHFPYVMEFPRFALSCLPRSALSNFQLNSTKACGKG